MRFCGLASNGKRRKPQITQIGADFKRLLKKPASKMAAARRGSPDPVGEALSTFPTFCLGLGVMEFFNSLLRRAAQASNKSASIGVIGIGDR